MDSEQREQLLRCCLLVAAADADIDARESWLVNRIAEELDVARADLNRIREAFIDRIGGVAELRRLRAETLATSPSTSTSQSTNVAAPVSAAVPKPAPLAAPAAAPAADLPPGVGLETVWLVEVPYTPEARERRPAFRRQHLARIARLRAEGRIIEAGGAADFSKAVLLVRGASEAEVLALIEADVYTSGGVWHNPTAVAYGRVVQEG